MDRKTAAIDQCGDFSLRRFYIRRMRRLFPAKAVSFATSTLAAVVLGSLGLYAQASGNSFYETHRLASAVSQSPGERIVDKPPLFVDKGPFLPSPPRYGEFGALWGDFNNDNRLDLIFMGHGFPGPLMLQQTEDRRFIDVSKESGIKRSNWEYPQQADTHGGSCGDFNSDGIPDLYIAHGAMREKTVGLKRDDLLQGKGLFKFVDVARAMGMTNSKGRARSGSWVDYDNDGHLDLYITNFQTPNVMYRNTGDGHFEDVTAKTGLGLKQIRAAWADFNQDGYLDVLLAAPLALYRNTGNGTFEDVTDKHFGKGGGYALALSWGDIDNDGDLDIFVSRGHKQSRLYLNKNGRFQRAADNQWNSKEGEIRTGVALADFDNDADLDVFQVQSDGYVLYRNEGNLVFTPQALALPAPDIKKHRNGDAAVADYNEDGMLDVAVDDMKRYSLLENRQQNGNHWLSLRFSGNSNNAMGFGTKVWVYSSGNLIAYREYSGNSGSYRSSGCAPLHIGLGSHEKVDLTVKWPGGKTIKLDGVDADQVLVVSDTEQ